MELRLSRHRAAEIKFDLAEGHKSFETKSQSEVFAKTQDDTSKSLGKAGSIAWCDAQPAIPYERSPYAPKFEDRSQEETEIQERCARGDEWRMV